MTDRPPAQDPSLLLRAEQASVTNEWLPVSRIRVTRRIVTEVQTLEVEVRREELLVTEEPLEGAAAPYPLGEAPVAPDPMVFVLSAEVPTVSLTVMPVERVTVTPTVVTEDRSIDLELRAERLLLDSRPLPATP